MTNSSISSRRMRALPKLQIHEHLDCSPRPRTMLELWEKIGFDKAKMAFPPEVLNAWRTANRARSLAKKRSLRKKAVVLYHDFLAKFASASLDNYLQAIGDHILPLMQTKQNLKRITRERIADAVTDGHVALELRFAPQLHSTEYASAYGGTLTMDEVMDTVIEAVKDSPIPIDLTVCALRHEGQFFPGLVQKLGALCVKYYEAVGCFDLAGGEGKEPGVLDWWVTEAVKVREERAKTPRPIKIKCHLWETNEPTDDDIAKLSGNDIVIVGHGVRGDRQGERFLECCPTSNVVTAQYASIGDHPIDRLFRSGHKVTVNTDGTLFTQVTLTGEYLKLQEIFGWNLSDFYRVNLNALEASNFPDTVKREIAEKLTRGYAQ
jgi:adenosine deaminase